MYLTSAQVSLMLGLGYAVLMWVFAYSVLYKQSNLGPSHGFGND